MNRRSVSQSGKATKATKKPEGPNKLVLVAKKIETGAGKKDVPKPVTSPQKENDSAETPEVGTAGYVEWKLRRKEKMLLARIAEIELKMNQQAAELDKTKQRELEKDKLIEELQTEKKADQRAIKQQQLRDKIDVLQRDSNTKVNNLTQTLQETQESSEAKIREKEEKIAEQAQTILDQQAEIEQLVKCSRSEIKQTRMQVKSENKSDIAVLLNRIRDLKTQLKDSGDLIKAKDKEIAKFQKLNERHTQIIFHKNSEISDLNRLKIELQNSLHEEQSKLTLESAKLRNTNEQVRKGEQEYSELQEEMRKYRSKNRLTIEENGDLKAENENLKFQLQSLKPKLDEEKDRCSLLENKYRDLLFGLEGCRQVIEEPKCLKQKVAALLGHFIENNSKLKVDEDTEKVNQHMSEVILEQAHRTERIVQHHKRENMHRDASRDSVVKELNNSFDPKQPLSKAPTPKQSVSKAPTPKQPLSKAPTPKQPLSKAPTPKQPLSKAPTPKQPLSKAPTPKQPLSKAPTPKQPLSKAPTSKQPKSR
ncbi:hypothetical protein WMY93_005538 [Mugilogobius chulae]|uniref:Uncharacterized protein n=1 Tax=Mugilogobius chulae TaxID=88201 RepID=A0AAW0PNK7_9GOBI